VREEEGNRRERGNGMKVGMVWKERIRKREVLETKVKIELTITITITE
jgi:hypothetical protein